MDNITHSLFGYALSRALPERPGRAEREESVLSWTGVLASNAPDLDLVIRFFAQDEKLAYLMHHRGHTHTLLWALPLGLLVASLVAAAHRLAGVRAWLRVLGLGAAAGGLHILFDAFNNYGVHPFHPLDSHWYYGDAVFIVEPLLLAVMIPLPALRARTRWGKLLGWGLAGALGWLLLGSGVLPSGLGWILAGLLGAAFGLFLMFQLGARGALWAVAVLVAGLVATSQVARAAMTDAFRQARPGERLIDLARSPYPGNPLCWNAAIVSVDATGGYHGRRADLSLAPSVFPVPTCRLREDGPVTAPGVPGSEYRSRSFVMHAEFAAPSSELRSLFEHNCRAAAALRFLRVPFWTRGEGAVIGDMRYDREPDLGFSEVPLTGHCGDPVPGWVPPRADLLQTPR